MYLHFTLAITETLCSSKAYQVGSNPPKGVEKQKQKMMIVLFIVYIKKGIMATAENKLEYAEYLNK